MIPVDRFPAWDDRDEDIKQWAIDHDVVGHHQTEVPLCEQTLSEQADTAIIYWDRPGFPVERFRWRKFLTKGEIYGSKETGGKGDDYDNGEPRGGGEVP
jgi:hypothetical protein